MPSIWRANRLNRRQPVSPILQQCPGKDGTRWRLLVVEIPTILVLNVILTIKMSQSRDHLLLVRPCFGIYKNKTECSFIHRWIEYMYLLGYQDESDISKPGLFLDMCQHLQPIKSESMISCHRCQIDQQTSQDWDLPDFPSKGN